MTSEEFRTIRQKLGLTQAELADLMGTRHQHISRIERGEREPTVQQAAALRLVVNLVECRQLLVDYRRRLGEL